MRPFIQTLLVGVFFMAMGGFMKMLGSVPPRHADNPLAVGYTKGHRVAAPYVLWVGLALTVIGGIGVIAKRLWS